MYLRPRYLEDIELSASRSTMGGSAFKDADNGDVFVALRSAGHGHQRV
jgi:hypothetical protein